MMTDSMQDTATSTDDSEPSVADPTDTTENRLRLILPGIIVVGLIGILSWWLGEFVPRLGGVTIAILLGIIAGNLIPDMRRYDAGVRFAEKRFLPVAIALLGVELQLMTLVSLGPVAALIIGISIATSLITSVYIGRWFNLSPKLSLLIGAGNGVCGSSAVAATAVAIDADEQDTGISISVVNLLGTIGIFVMPALAGLLAYDDAQGGLLIGSTLQAVGQVVAAGFSLNNDVGSLATVVKMGRVLMLGPVVILVQSFVNRQTTSSTRAPAVKIPLFIVCFLILSLLASFQILPADLVTGIKTAGKFILIVAMAAIGMKIQLNSLFQSGVRTLLAGSLVSFAQIIVVVLFIHLLA